MPLDLFSSGSAMTQNEILSSMQSVGATASPWFTAASAIYGAYAAGENQKWQSEVDHLLKEINAKLDSISLELHEVLAMVRNIPADINILLNDRLRKQILSYGEVTKTVSLTRPGDASPGALAQIEGYRARLLELASQLQTEWSWTGWSGLFLSLQFRYWFYRYLFSAQKGGIGRKQKRLEAFNEAATLISTFESWLNPSTTDGPAWLLNDRIGFCQAQVNATVPFCNHTIGISWRGRNGSATDAEACAATFQLVGSIKGGFGSSTPGSWQEGGWWPRDQIEGAFMSMPDAPYIFIPGGQDKGKMWAQYNQILSCANQRSKDYLAACPQVDELTTTCTNMGAALEVMRLMQKDVVNWR